MLSYTLPHYRNQPYANGIEFGKMDGREKKPKHEDKSKKRKDKTPKNEKFVCSIPRISVPFSFSEPFGAPNSIFSTKFSLNSERLLRNFCMRNSLHLLAISLIVVSYSVGQKTGGSESRHREEAEDGS
jgi:hypothetical protein